jgi:hypothetical protein
MNFGISLVLGVGALQQAIMFGGLSTDTFQSRMLSLAIAITNATQQTCAHACTFLDINDTVAEISQVNQQLDAEVAMVFFETLMFLFLIPVTLAFYASRDAKPSALLRIFPVAVVVEGGAAGRAGSLPPPPPACSPVCAVLLWVGACLPACLPV